MMARSPRSSEPRTVDIMVRVTPADAAIIDRLRGEWTRAEWCRRALARSGVDLYRGQILLVPKLTGPPRDEDVHPVNVMKRPEKRNQHAQASTG